MVEIGEAVDVDVQQRDPRAAALGVRQGLSQAIAEQGTIREPGQRVVKGESLDELLRALTLGQVHDDPDAAAYPLRRVEQRCRADRDPLFVAARAQTELSFVGAELSVQRRLGDGNEVRLVQVAHVGANDALFGGAQEFGEPCIASRDPQAGVEEKQRGRRLLEDGPVALLRDSQLLEGLHLVLPPVSYTHLTLPTIYSV